MHTNPSSYTSLNQGVQFDWTESVLDFFGQVYPHVKRIYEGMDEDDITSLHKQDWGQAHQNDEVTKR